MRYSNIFAPFALAALANATPLSKRAVPSDPDILNLALALEHLEDAFYREGLARFSQQDFDGQHLPGFVRGRVQQIGQHESAHVTFLTAALTAAGAPVSQACTYKFPVNNARDFVDVAAVLEQVGASAYSGAAPLIDNADFVAAGAAILAVEARHSAWLSSAAKKQNPWSTEFETPLPPSHAFSLAVQFIVSCPDSNPQLPFTAFPTVSVPAGATPGQTVKLTFSIPITGPVFAAFLSGLHVHFVPIASDLTVTIPANLLGTSYMVVTNDSTKVDDAHTVAGPAILTFPFNSRGQLL